MANYVNLKGVNKKINVIGKKALLEIVKPMKVFDPSSHILIFADPRGGSTWITEVISTIPNTSVMWEPLTVEQMPAFERLNFVGSGRRQHIPKHEKWTEARTTFEDLFSGSLTNYFLVSRTSLIDYATSSNLIFKFTKGTGILPWLCENFSFNFRPLHFIRHPFAVVSSQIHHGAWGYTYNQFSIPDRAYVDIYKRNKHFLETLHTKEEELTAVWCIHNTDSIKSKNKKWISLTYENTLLKPQQAIEYLFTEWGLGVPSTAYNLIEKPSRTTKEGSLKSNPMEQISKWKNYFSDEKIKSMKRVLDYFEVELYSDNFLPHYALGV